MSGNRCFQFPPPHHAGHQTLTNENVRTEDTLEAPRSAFPSHHSSLLCRREPQEEEDAGHLGDDEDDTQKERNQKTSNSHNTDTPQTVQSLCSTANGRHSCEESRASGSHLVLQGNPPHFIWTDLLVKCKETSITYYLRENVGVTHRTLFEWSCCGASNAGSSHSQTRHCLQLASSARERGLKVWWLRLHLIDQSSNYNS